MVKILEDVSVPLRLLCVSVFACVQLFLGSQVCRLFWMSLSPAPLAADVREFVVQVEKVTKQPDKVCDGLEPLLPPSFLLKDKIIRIQYVLLFFFNSAELALFCNSVCP